MFPETNFKNRKTVKLKKNQIRTWLKYIHVQNEVQIFILAEQYGYILYNIKQIKKYIFVFYCNHF